MKHALFIINPSSSQEKALDELLSNGLEHPYFIEEIDSSIKIGGFFIQLPQMLQCCSLIEHNEGIDWNKEWETHSPYYKNGLLEIDLNDFGANLVHSKLYLRPGPGFGDLSHPTTHLMLQTMAPYIKGKDVIDIGCGSGILSLAAHKMGAKSVIGIDIENEALEHSRKNAILNSSPEVKFHKSLNPIGLKGSNSVFLINMTFEEQKQIFESYPNLKGTFIVSGLLNTQKVNFLKAFPYKDYIYIEDYKCGDWISIIFFN